ncbi:translocation protein S66 [Quaeritorhiza haematococci]|nr:translocation protein S66 [Quaeritorhiza haematococci]
MRRAMEDVKRIWQIREEKPPLMNLVKQGAIGEDLWEKVVRAEQELEAEILEVLEEADLYRKGWRDTIFQEASKYMQIQIAREAQLQAQMEAANNASPGQDETEEAGEGEDDSEEAQTASPSTPEEEQLTEEERSQRAMEELIRDEELEKQKLAKKQQQSPQNSNGKAGGKKKKKK